MSVNGMSAASSPSGSTTSASTSPLRAISSSRAASACWNVSSLGLSLYFSSDENAASTMLSSSSSPTSTEPSGLLTMSTPPSTSARRISSGSPRCSRTSASFGFPFAMRLTLVRTRDSTRPLGGDISRCSPASRRKVKSRPTSPPCNFLGGDRGVDRLDRGESTTVSRGSTPGLGAVRRPQRKEPPLSKPVVLVAGELSPAGLTLLEADFEVRRTDGAARTGLLAAVADVDAIIVRSATDVAADVFAAARRLRVVARADVGHDNDDNETATKAGGMVVNAPTSNIVTAAEHASALLLATARNVPQ